MWNASVDSSLAGVPKAPQRSRRVRDALQRSQIFRIFSLVLASLSLVSWLEAQTTRLSGDQTRILTNIQSGAVYNVQASDCGKLLSFSSANQVAVTIPQAAAGCWMDIQNTGTGAVILTPLSSTIDSAASIQLTTNQGLRLVSTGSAYLSQRGGQGSGTGGGSGTVTATDGPLTIGSLVTGNGSTDIKTSSATIDARGNLSIPGTITVNTTCNGCAGAVDLLAGSDPGSSQTPNSFSLVGPSTILSPFRWRVPAADAAGAIVSDGVGTPGQLSITPIATTSTASAIVKTGSGGALDPSFLPPPTPSMLGGTKAIDCTGTGHILKIDTTGTPSCSADSGGGGGGAGTLALQTLTLPIAAGPTNGACTTLMWSSWGSGTCVGSNATVGFPSAGSGEIRWNWTVPSNINTGQPVSLLATSFDASGNGGWFQWQIKIGCIHAGSAMAAVTWGATSTSSAFQPSPSQYSNTPMEVTVSSIDMSACSAGQAASISLTRNSSVSGNSGDALNLVRAALTWSNQ